MSPQDMKDTLIARTISVIADVGLDKTTTKAIVSGTGINEVYIYRHFTDKEHLLSVAFDKLDNKLVDKALECVQVMYRDDLDYELRCRKFYDDMWRFLLGDKAECMAFVQYYYSPYFRKYSAGEHKKRFLPLVDKFKSAFREEADVWMLLNHILNVMFDFVIKVYDGDLPDNDDTQEHVYRLIYVSVQQYFKKKEQ